MDPSLNVLLIGAPLFHNANSRILCMYEYILYILVVYCSIDSTYVYNGRGWEESVKKAQPCFKAEKKNKLSTGCWEGHDDDKVSPELFYQGGRCELPGIYFIAAGDETHAQYSAEMERPLGYSHEYSNTH